MNESGAGRSFLVKQEYSICKIDDVKLKFTARAILIAIVFIATLNYVVDFINPLTPDPPAILQSLQWRILVSFVALALALTLLRLTLIKLLAASPEARFVRANTRPASPMLILDLTCSRLI